MRALASAPPFSPFYNESTVKLIYDYQVMVAVFLFHYDGKEINFEGLQVKGTKRVRIFVGLEEMIKKCLNLVDCLNLKLGELKAGGSLYRQRWRPFFRLRLDY